MALGKRKPVQQPLFVSTAELNVRCHPFYDAVNKVLNSHHFDTFVGDRCAKFYDDGVRGGRPGLAPGIHFRCLLVGYFEGIDSERGIDWRYNDSHSLKAFLGLAIDQTAPDHSTFNPQVPGQRRPDRRQGPRGGRHHAGGQRRDAVHRPPGQRRGYQQFLTKLAKESGIETPTREDLAEIDKKRKNKASNDDWESPDDPDAKITKIRDWVLSLDSSQDGRRPESITLRACA